MDYYGMTDPGLVRQNNEDNFLVDAALSLALVADGMGGAACGEIASALTIETVTGYLRYPLEELPADQLIKEAFREANRRVLDRAVREEDCQGMGSTVVAAFWHLPQIVVANVGDSRAYLWRDGALAQLSYDQTLANELRTTLGLTEEQIHSYTTRNVLTMAIGASENILVNTRQETLRPGDRILLCSDGLYGSIGDQAVAQILREAAPLRPTVEKLVEAAKSAGGEDNITAVLLEYVKDD